MLILVIPISYLSECVFVLRNDDIRCAYADAYNLKKSELMHWQMIYFIHQRQKVRLWIQILYTGPTSCFCFYLFILLNICNIQAINDYQIR